SFHLTSHVLNDSPTFFLSASATTITCALSLHDALPIPFSAADPNSPFPRSPAVATVSIEVGGTGGRSLLAGDATSTYSVGDQTAAGREEAFKFTERASGTVEEMQFRNNSVANTGVTGLK